VNLFSFRILRTNSGCDYCEVVHICKSIQIPMFANQFRCRHLLYSYVSHDQIFLLTHCFYFESDLNEPIQWFRAANHCVVECCNESQVASCIPGFLLLYFVITIFITKSELPSCILGGIIEFQEPGRVHTFSDLNWAFQFRASFYHLYVILVLEIDHVGCSLVPCGRMNASSCAS